MATGGRVITFAYPLDSDSVKELAEILYNTLRRESNLSVILENGPSREGTTVFFDISMKDGLIIFNESRPTQAVFNLSMNFITMPGIGGVELNKVAR
jgi:hypothetical protein